MTKLQTHRAPLTYVPPDPTTFLEAQGPRRPFLTTATREGACTRVEAWAVRPARSGAGGLDSPEYLKGEQIAARRRDQSRRMSLAETCQRMARVMALTGGLALAVNVSAAAPSPIRALEVVRTGRFALQTTIVIEAHPDNLAVCVGLTGATYPVRWGCQYVAEPTDTAVTIAWQDVPAGQYAVEAGVWRGRPQWLATRGKKLSLTIRRAFGVREL